MHGIFTYRIEVQGKVDEKVLNANSPMKMIVNRAEGDSTVVMIHTDQSGLIGLMRHLHGQGFVFRSLNREG
jgi:hypothetical protein